MVGFTIGNLLKLSLDKGTPSQTVSLPNDADSHKNREGDE
jgi:hypothetical protein